MRQYRYDLLYVLHIDQDYFDLKSFKISCGQFIKGGRYENVFKVEKDTNTKHIIENQLVVFELTEIKKDPFLVTLVLLILQETIDSNILSDRSNKGVLIFDEFAETAQIKDSYTGEEVLQTVSVLNQKIRKENGSIYLIVQDFAQLPDNPFTKSIIRNTQLFYMLPSTMAAYQDAKDTLKLTDSEYSQLVSIQNNYHTAQPFSEFFLKRFEASEVLRNELSPAAYLAFQTKGDLWDKLNAHYSTTNNLEASINHILKLQS